MSKEEKMKAFNEELRALLAKYEIGLQAQLAIVDDPKKPAEEVIPEIVK